MSPAHGTAKAFVWVALAATGAAACSAGSPKTRIMVAPVSSLNDRPVATSVAGLPANTTATVTAAAVDADGTTWSSVARFAVPAAGRITLADPSVGGSYTGADAMGLFETMTNAGEPYFVSSSATVTVTLSVSENGRRLTTAVLRRLSPTGSGLATSRDLRPAADGVYGELFTPTSPPGKQPAVVVFGGSEGGLSTTTLASRLAAHGYPALALAYFHEPGLPQNLENIPLEYFAAAAKIVAAAPGADPAHVLTMGISRGGEAALLVAAHYPSLVHGAISLAGASVAVPGLPDLDNKTAAWTLGGVPVPTVPATDLNDPQAADNPAAVIPVEKIAGPVLTMCGEQDDVWDSCGYAAAVIKRLTDHHSPYPHEELRYPKAGHGAAVLVPYTLSAYFSSGQTANGFAVPFGDPLANQQAAADAWPKVLAFIAASG